MVAVGGTALATLGPAAALEAPAVAGAGAAVACIAGIGCALKGIHEKGREYT